MAHMEGEHEAKHTDGPWSGPQHTSAVCISARPLCRVCLECSAPFLWLPNSDPRRTREGRRRPGTHYVKLEEVTEARGAVDANQDAILHGGAEAHGQAVRARAGPVVGRPGVEDEASALPKDVGGASCKSKEREPSGREELAGRRHCGRPQTAGGDRPT